MTDRSPVPASDIYNVDRWGDSYFRIDDQGQLCVRPNGEQGGQATLEAVLESCRAAGLRAPVLARFSGILRQRVKLLAAEVADMDVKGQAPGTVLDDQLTIATGEGAIRLLTLQKAGGKPLKAEDFLRGTKVAPGTVIG